MNITNDIIELVKLIGSLPGDVIIGISIYVLYKVITYLSTAGAIVYLGSKLLDKFPSFKIEKTEK